MRLEQIAYESRQLQEKIQVYRVGDLERLSASALYTPKISIPKIGMTLSGGLEIYKVRKNTVVLKQDLGLLRDLYDVHPDGHGSLKNIALTPGKSTLLNKKSW